MPLKMLAVLPLLERLLKKYVSDVLKKNERLGAVVLIGKTLVFITKTMWVQAPPAPPRTILKCFHLNTTNDFHLSIFKAPQVTQV